MIIQDAIQFLTKIPEKHKYFIEQLQHFHVEHSSPLKDYLDIIDNDVLLWLNNSPLRIKAKSTFYKFKSPIHSLLESSLVIEQYGQSYCTNLAKKITQVFSKHIQGIINERNPDTNVNIEETTHTETTSDTESNDGTEIDLEKLEPSKLEHTHSTKNNHDLITQIELLKHKLDTQKLYYEAMLNSQDKHHNSLIKYYDTTLMLITNNNENLIKLILHQSTQ